MTNIEISIGDFFENVHVYVVEEMADNVFILGRDILDKFQCVIDYKTLSFTINNCTLPLMKPTNSSQIKPPIGLYCAKTIIIPPLSSGLIKGYLKSNSKKSKRFFMSVTGVSDVYPKSGLHTSSGLANCSRGKTSIAVKNITNIPLIIYRNSKIGNFHPLHSLEINSLNYDYIENEPLNKVDENCVPHPPEKYKTKPVENKIPIAEHHRWVHNIDDLYRILKLDELNHLSPQELEQVKSLVAKYRDIFSENDDDVGCTDISEQEIILDTKEPIRDKYYNIPLALRPHAEKEVKRLVDLNILQPSTSSYHSPSFLMKKPDGSYRLLTDFRKINAHTIRSWQPIPGLEEMVVLWNKCEYFSKLDFVKGFYQTKLNPESRKYTATSIPGVGFFEYVRSPLGLSNSPCFFQSVVEKMLMGLKNDQCVVFLDDILSGAINFGNMLDNLTKIFERIKLSKMLLSPSKCELFKNFIKYLGVVLDKSGIRTCPDKVEAIVKMTPPKNIKAVRSYLGLSGFYRRFIRNYSQIAEPLTRLTKKNAHFNWTQEAQTAWQTIKDKLITAPILAHPDINKPFFLVTDSSNYCIGGILAQKDENEYLHPVSYGSAILNETQRRWSTVQRELYALVYFCKKYHSFLLGQEFTVITDNKGLLNLEKFKDIKSDRLWRWFETLQNYKFKVEYTPTSKNPSDALSRLPCKDDPLISTLTNKSEVASQANFISSLSVSNTKNEHYAAPIISFTNEDMKKLQHQDSTLKTVYSWLESGSKPKNSANLNPDLYTYFNSYGRLSLKDGIICRKWDQLTSESPIDLVCVPKVIQTDIISASHDIPSAGHMGQFKTMQRIRSRFYFPKMDLKVKLHIAACHVCLKRRNNVPKLKAPLTPYNGRYPGHIVQIDLMENLPPVDGCTSILVIIDTFSKWAEVVALRSTKVEWVAKAFVDIWICRQGIPTQVHSDRGGNVETSEIIQNVYKLLGIRKTANLSYRPQTDGAVERLIRTLKNIIWKFCQKNPKNWINCLQQIMFAYRTSVHASTGFSPFFMDKGRLPRLPMDVITGTTPSITLNKTYGNVALNLYNSLNDAFEHVESILKTKHISSKKRYDTGVKVKTFDVGSWVYVWKPAPHLCTYKKFYDHYRGPFKIVEQLTPHTYKIVLDKAAEKFDIVHMEFLKDANIPKDSNPPMEIKHYSDNLVSPEEFNEQQNRCDDPGREQSFDMNNDKVNKMLSPKERKKTPRKGLLIKIPNIRRLARVRTPHVPYQY